jgi:hypothetical protein
LEVDISAFPNVMAHFKRMLDRPSVKKVLAYEREVNEGFAKTAQRILGRNDYSLKVTSRGLPFG